jgi:hypothetical protein
METRRHCEISQKTISAIQNPFFCFCLCARFDEFFTMQPTLLDHYICNACDNPFKAEPGSLKGPLLRHVRTSKHKKYEKCREAFAKFEREQNATAIDADFDDTSPMSESEIGPTLSV